MDYHAALFAFAMREKIMLMLSIRQGHFGRFIQKKLQFEVYTVTEEYLEFHRGTYVRVTHNRYAYPRIYILTTCPNTTINTHSYTYK